MGNFVRILEPEKLSLEPAGIVLNRQKKWLNRRLKKGWTGWTYCPRRTTGRLAKRQVVSENGSRLCWTTCRTLRLPQWGAWGAWQTREAILAARAGAWSSFRCGKKFEIAWNFLKTIMGLFVRLETAWMWPGLFEARNGLFDGVFLEFARSGSLTQMLWYHVRNEVYISYIRMI